MLDQSRTAAVLALVLALVLVHQVSQPGPLLGYADAPAAFAAGLTVPPAPVPLVHTERADLRVAQLVASMDGMWRAVFAAEGDEYVPARIDTSATEEGAEVGCGGGTPTGWAGIYCPADRRVVIDLGDHQVLRAAAGDAAADDLFGYVLAHVIGHHVQHLRHAPPFDTPDATVRRELQAQCLAGVWGRAAGRRPPPAETYAADADHGSA